MVLLTKADIERLRANTGQNVVSVAEQNLEIILSRHIAYIMGLL